MDAEDSDEQLMLAFCSGDARAFELLVRRHRTAVFNFILRFTGHRQKAEDLLQETWLRVVRGTNGYQPKARFTTWVFTLARNLCVDGARKDAYRRTDSLDAAAGPGDERPLGETVADGAQALPDRGAHNARLRPLLERAIASLPAEQREVFLLREYAGISFREIADIAGVSENTVKSRMRYALEALRKRLEALGVDGAFDSDERTVTG